MGVLSVLQRFLQICLLPLQRLETDIRGTAILVCLNLGLLCLVEGSTARLQLCFHARQLLRQSPHSTLHLHFDSVALR